MRDPELKFFGDSELEEITEVDQGMETVNVDFVGLRFARLMDQADFMNPDDEALVAMGMGWA